MTSPPELFEVSIDGLFVDTLAPLLDLRSETFCGYQDGLCGGCDHCLAMQAEHYGDKLVEFGLLTIQFDTSENYFQ